MAKSQVVMPSEGLCWAPEFEGLRPGALIGRIEKCRHPSWCYIRELDQDKDMEDFLLLMHTRLMDGPLMLMEMFG